MEASSGPVSAVRFRDNFRVALTPALTQILNALAALSMPMSIQISLIPVSEKTNKFCRYGERPCHQNFGGVHGSPCAAATT